MLRQFASITLVVSFIALGVSGLLMIVLNSFTFQMQMHPVHKVFGIIMTLAGCVHVILNLRSIKNYLKNTKTLVLGGSLSLFLIFLTIVGLNKPMDQENIQKIEQVMSQMERKE